MNYTNQNEDVEFIVSLDYNLEAFSEFECLEWGDLYEVYHKTPYDPKKISQRVHDLYADPYIKDRKGIFEFILGGEIEKKLLNLRVFDEATKRLVYKSQNDSAKKNDKSNCSYCAIGHDSNKNKLWNLKDMDADHVTAWTKGGATDIKNCEMLCKTHNRAKGNR